MTSRPLGELYAVIWYLCLTMYWCSDSPHSSWVRRGLANWVLRWLVGGRPAPVVAHHLFRFAGGGRVLATQRLTLVNPADCTIVILGSCAHAGVMRLLRHGGIGGLGEPLLELAVWYVCLAVPSFGKCVWSIVIIPFDACRAARSSVSAIHTSSRLPSATSTSTVAQSGISHGRLQAREPTFAKRCPWEELYSTLNDLPPIG